MCGSPCAITSSLDIFQIIMDESWMISHELRKNFDYFPRKIADILTRLRLLKICNGEVLIWKFCWENQKKGRLCELKWQEVFGMIFISNSKKVFGVTHLKVSIYCHVPNWIEIHLKFQGNYGRGSQCSVRSALKFRI